MDEKLELVEKHRDGHGLNACLGALGVSKGSWHYRMRDGSRRQDREARDAALRPMVVEVIGENPGYGYRRIQPDLELAAGEPVNHKRLRRLLNQWDLALHRVVVRPKPSQVVRILNDAKGHLNLAAGMEPGPLELLSTDFTEILFDGGRRKAHLIAMIDVDSEWVPGWAVGLSKDGRLAGECWDQVVGSYAEFGRDLVGVVVHQDQDSERGARDNPWIESFWARFKGENGSLFLEARDLPDLRGLIKQQMRYYNRRRRHSSLDNRPPLAYLKSEGIGPRILSTD